MLDTNILISMIFFPSEQTRRLVHELNRRHQIVLCDYVIKELESVIDRKFPGKSKALRRFLEELPYELIKAEDLRCAENVYIRDIKDLPVLTAAIVSKVDVMITGDKDFLALSREFPEILTMSEFEKRYIKIR